MTELAKTITQTVTEKASHVLNLLYGFLLLTGIQGRSSYGYHARSAT
jgi:hypothetical protein